MGSLSSLVFLPALVEHVVLRTDPSDVETLDVCRFYFMCVDCADLTSEKVYMRDEF